MRPLAVQKRGQPGLAGAEQREVLGELAVQEAGGIGAFGADHAEVGQGTAVTPLSTTVVIAELSWPGLFLRGGRDSVLDPRFHRPGVVPSLFLSSVFIGPVRSFFLTLFLLAAGALALGAAGSGGCTSRSSCPRPASTCRSSPAPLPRGIAQAVADAGVDVSRVALRLVPRVGPGPPDQGRQLRAGTRHHAQALLNKLARGEEVAARLTLVEGWNMAPGARRAGQGRPAASPTAWA
jgi:hypothetical protein